MTWYQALLALVTLCAVLSAPAAAHAQAPSPAPRAEGPRWEIEASGGLSIGRWTSGGRTVLPDPGEPIATSSPVFPSWRVPSWFFGDGAAFLNNVAGEFGLTNRLAPLDAVLGAGTVDDAGTLQFGVRVRRTLAPRYWLEVGVELTGTSLRLADDLKGTAAAATASFQSTFAELLATGPFTSPVVSAGVREIAGAGREVAFTAALVGDTRLVKGFIPYVVAGGGLITQVGGSPEVILEGMYRFALPGGAPINETDRVTLRYSGGPRFTGVLGGGLRRNVTERWGFRIDGRVLLGQAATRVALEATPESQAGTPAGYIESFTYPNLQFSNSTSTGRVSTLSGSVSDFATSSGGIQTRGRITFGVYVRY